MLTTLDTECSKVDQLGAACTAVIKQHPDHHCITSFPGLGDTPARGYWPNSATTANALADPRAINAYVVQHFVTRTAGSRTTASPPQAGP